MEDEAAQDARWGEVRAALERNEIEEAARLVLRTPLMPALHRQLQATFPRVPPAYVEDALAEALAETFQRLERGHDVDFGKVGGYIFNTARFILTRVLGELKGQQALIDPERTPYDAEMVDRLGGLGEVSEDPKNRLRALELLASLIDALPSSDSAKQVLKVRFDGAIHGDWLTNDEVAEVIAKNPTSIGSWWRRGLADLTAYCTEHGITRDGLEQLANEFDELEADQEDEGDDEEYGRDE